MQVVVEVVEQTHPLLLLARVMLVALEDLVVAEQVEIEKDQEQLEQLTLAVVVEQVEQDLLVPLLQMVELEVMES
jgi:hypothetical protein